jgi:hypothetical protein
MTTTGNAMDVGVIVAGSNRTTTLGFSFAFGELRSAFHRALTLLAAPQKLQRDWKMALFPSLPVIPPWMTSSRPRGEEL